MQVRQDGGGARPSVVVTLEAVELAALIGGAPLQFERAGVDGGRICVELLVEGGVAGQGRMPVDVRLRLPPLGLNGIVIGGRLTPIFPNVPFQLVLEAKVPTTGSIGPIRVAPGLSYTRIDMDERAPLEPEPLPPRPAVSAAPRASSQPDAEKSWSLIAAGGVLLGVAVLCFLERASPMLTTLIGAAGVAALVWGWDPRPSRGR